jgi:competence protein ComEA
MDKFRLVFGLGVIGMILGSGVLMSLFLLRQEDSQISPAEWERLNKTISELVARQNSLPPPASAKASVLSSLSTQVNINTASVGELDALPGIGQVRAKALVDERAAHGLYKDSDDIRARVPKIPASVLEEISPQIVFE